MKINKDKLQKALEIVKPGLANNEIIEQSASFAFLEDRVVTYNDSISLSHPVEELDLRGAIRAEELYEFLNKTDKEQIQIKTTENQLGLVAGKTKAGLKLKSEIVLPIQETGEVGAGDWEQLPGEEEFAHNLDFIKDSTSKDMSRRVLTCVNVEETYMEASDSFQIMRVYLDVDNPFPFSGSLIPAENIGEIKKIEPHEVAETNGWLHFRNREGTVLSCRVLMDNYPSTEGHFEVEGQRLVFPDEMQKILDRVMVFTKRDNLMDEEMQVLLKKGQLLVKGENEYGWIKEQANVKYSGGKTSFWITPYLLKNILERSNECAIGKEKIKFEGGDWEYVAVLREN